MGTFDERSYHVALVYPNGAMDMECQARSEDEAKRISFEKNKAAQHGQRYAAYRFERTTTRTVID